MLRRLGYVAIVLIWLAIMCLPILAVTVAMRGELNIGDSERGHIRVFLVQHDEQNGLGFEWGRIFDDRQNCLETSVRYLLWEGDSTDSNTDYCRCTKMLDGQVLYDRAC